MSVFFTCQDLGKKLHVFVDETRPLLQGSRLTAWELKQRGIDTTLICDSMAAQVMREGRVQPLEPAWNPSGYLWNAIDKVRLNVEAA